MRLRDALYPGPTAVTDIKKKQKCNVCVKKHTEPKSGDGTFTCVCITAFHYQQGNIFLSQFLFELIDDFHLDGH